ncbi:indole-3-glycerol phosphate synthase TrpC [Parasulfitobacter algicola]|uniref:Indole-3-glycerol phosphate synthase n=1 Tax=Parasulfitobacter algicola TaxID=2614809 RepID=A0ABX2IS09_9RHOB|nr:indole-3-glycerol phosphate synthase TrpC [Sulfitobacter algicola]NSX55684.1 indole-3-glycerol phosphate synthase TrpC [Sulfitobacter algicola]
MTATILEKIKAYKLDEVAARKQQTPLADLQTAAANAPPVRGFADALEQAMKTGYGLIAEIKKASPSKGVIRDDFDPVALAKAYEDGGATCLSVLTDTPSFQGADTFLTDARSATELPALRKDFMYDPYQVIEARALHADCILIIMASIDDTLAKELEDTAIDYKMDVLIEVHNEIELDRAMGLKSRLIGINNRDLHSFVTDINVTKTLSRLVHADKTIISESGLNTPEELADLAMYGARAFLIGESLMRHDDVTAATRALIGNPLTPVGGGL